MCLAIPGQITAVNDEDELLRMGEVDFAGVTKKVSLACVPDAAIGDYVLVHVGVAITRIDEDEAQKIFGFLEEIGEIENAADHNA